MSWADQMELVMEESPGQNQKCDKENGEGVAEVEERGWGEVMPEAQKREGMLARVEKMSLGKGEEHEQKEKL